MIISLTPLNLFYYHQKNTENQTFKHKHFLLIGEDYGYKKQESTLQLTKLNIGI